MAVLPAHGKGYLSSPSYSRNFRPCEPMNHAFSGDRAELSHSGIEGCLEPSVPSLSCNLQLPTFSHDCKTWQDGPWGVVAVAAESLKHSAWNTADEVRNLTPRRKVTGTPKRAPCFENLPHGSLQIRGPRYGPQNGVILIMGTRENPKTL